jgi:hypothetical protein
VTAVGNEFSGVEALWSRFESVMGKGGGEAASAGAAGTQDGGAVEGSVREGDTEVSGSSVAGGEVGDEEESTVLEGRRRR